MAAISTHSTPFPRLKPPCDDLSFSRKLGFCTASPNIHFGKPKRLSVVFANAADGQHKAPSEITLSTSDPAPPTPRQKCVVS
nr:acetolactate synthase small subunit 1, chloroplastic-like [Ipomoea batatas]